jgi:hypothetical protein
MKVRAELNWILAAAWLLAGFLLGILVRQLGLPGLPMASGVLAAAAVCAVIGSGLPGGPPLMRGCCWKNTGPPWKALRFAQCKPLSRRSLKCNRKWGKGPQL